MMITKRNISKFSRKYLLPKDDGYLDLSSFDEIRRNQDLIARCRIMFDTLYDFRRNRRRNVDYTFGRQLNDLMQDPDGCGYITEREYVMRQGNVPLITNVIRKTVKAIVGAYRTNKTEPYVISRDRDEQKLGEMVTTAMQYEYQTNQIHEINARSYEEFNISGMAGWRVGYGWNHERQTKDVYVESIDQNRVFFDNNTSGLYMENISTIGYLHDLSLDELDELSETAEQSDLIRSIYSKWKAYDMPSLRSMFDGDRRSDIDFFAPEDTSKYRVIEVWTKESERCIRCHDTLLGKWEIYPESELPNIEFENQRRKDELVSLGGSEEDAALIYPEMFIHRYWVARWLTPSGYVIKQMESPYWHNSHPFVIGAYPLVDGEIHSVVEDSIPTQRLINRLVQRIEFVRMASAKGVLIVPEQLLEGKNLNDIASEWTKANGIIALKWKDGIPMPQQLSTNPNIAGDMDLLKMQISILDDITGVHGALRGETPRSGTPSSLYAQEAQNASTNIADAQEWYNGLVKRRDTKMMKLIQQYFDEVRYLNVVGKDYSEESKWYNPEKVRNAEFDLSLVESQGNAVARAANETLLMELLKMGAIDAQLYLESSSAPYSDKLLERIKQRREELQQQQQALQQQGQTVNPYVEQAMR